VTGRSGRAARRQDAGGGSARARVEIEQPVAPLRALHERRDEPAELRLHRAAEVAALGERARVEAVQEVLERLAGREDAEVRERRARQVAPHHVACVRAHGRAVRPLRRLQEVLVPLDVLPGERLARLRVPDLDGLDREDLLDVPDHRVDLRGVRRKEAVHERREGRAVARREQRLLALPEEVPRGVPLVEADVARGLLEERDPDARVLERLRGDVRRPFHGHVRGAKLRDGVVAVADEDAVVERAGPPERLAVVRRRPAGEEAFREPFPAHELVEEDAAEALRRPAVAREEGACDFLRELQPENGRVDVREEAGRTSASSGVNSGVMSPRSYPSVRRDPHGGDRHERLAVGQPRVGEDEDPVAARPREEGDLRADEPAVGDHVSLDEPSA
jgi:hypothetical protein